MNDAYYIVGFLLFVCVVVFWRWFNGGSLGDDMEVLAMEQMVQEARLQTEKALAEIDDTNRRISSS